MSQPGRSPEVDAELKKLQGVQNGEGSATWRYSLMLMYVRFLYVGSSTAKPFTAENTPSA